MDEEQRRREAGGRGEAGEDGGRREAGGRTGEVGGRRGEAGGGGGMYDLTAHPNEYIKAYSGALRVPPEPGHYGGGGGASLFFLADGRQ